MLDIWVLNVGHGDSIVLRCKSASGPAYAVIDSNRAANQTPAALTKLRQLQATQLSFVMLTHPHADHYQGLSDILKAFSGRVRHFYTFPLGDYVTTKASKLRDLVEKMISATEGSHQQSLIELLEILAHARREKRAGRMEWHESAGPWNRMYPPGFDGVRMEVLLPLPKCKGAFFQLIDKQDPKAFVSEGPNSVSVALRISVGSTVVLLGADAAYMNWYDHRRQTRASGDHPAAVAVKIPHHGSKHDVKGDTVGYWFKPVTDGDARRFGLVSADGRRHPHVEALEALRVAGVHPYCTNLARPCGGAKVDAMFTASEVPLNVRRVINSGDVEAPMAMQPCQGEIHVHIDAQGQMTVTPEFNNACGFRGDYDALGLGGTTSPANQS